MACLLNSNWNVQIFNNDARPFYNKIFIYLFVINDPKNFSFHFQLGKKKHLTLSHCYHTKNYTYIVTCSDFIAVLKALLVPNLK